VIAEGVETQEQLRKLYELDGRYAQGFLFSEPLDATETESVLAAWEPPKIAAIAA
jgi:EAL domain-containing protein (putative c-di-GMP-specific phosphodiesterase class I)